MCVLADAKLLPFTLFVPSNSQQVPSHSPSNIWANRCKVGLVLEKSAHILTVDSTVLTSLFGAVSLF